MAYRNRDGLENTTMILASLSYELRVEEQRYRVLVFQLILFAASFLALVCVETMFSVGMFSILQIEILGRVYSGAAFALLVPTVILYAHVRSHYEGDHFLRWWLRTLSGIGVPIFALGISLTIGYSAWLAARDAVDVISTAPTGLLGDTDVGSGSDANASSDIAGWIAVIPNGMLFLGLSFATIITISLASFCLGRALEAFNILTLTPRIGKDVRVLIEAATAKTAEFRKLRDRDTAERRKLPFDINAKFAREAAYAGWEVGQAKLAAARRVFDPMTKNDPLAAIMRDPAAGTIPSHFRSEDEFARHMAEQMDAMRAHNILRVLGGFPGTGKDQL